MRHISILVPNGEPILSSVVGPVMVFNWVNSVLAAQGHPPAYAVDLVGVAPETGLYEGVFAIRPSKRLHELERTDLVLIPAFNGDLVELVRMNEDAIAWVRAMRTAGAEVGSLCTGAFLLAATGLMSGQRCTTHWLVSDLFRTTFPDVDLRVERIVTDENGIYSSGGATSFFNLVLHLVEKFNGRDMALQAAKTFEIDIDRSSQGVFLVFQGMKGHRDMEVLKAQRIMEARHEEALNMEAIALDLALSPRNFSRRFKEATGLTPLEYLQHVRVEVAKKNLERNSPVNDAMYASGYSDHKAFRQVFKRLTSMSPTAYRARYGHPVRRQELVQ